MSLTGKDLVAGLRITGTPDSTLEPAERLLAEKPDADAAAVRGALVKALHKHGRMDDFVRENGTIKKADAILAGANPNEMIAHLKPPPNSGEAQSQKLADAIKDGLKSILPDLMDRHYERQVDRPEPLGAKVKAGR